MKSLLLALLALSFTVHADYPPNIFYYPPEVTSSAVAENDFSDAIKEVQRHYAPVVKAILGCELKIKNKWSSGTVNAYADRVGNDCQVEMHGGFARYPGMTKGAVLGILCHEVGHHMGGKPDYGYWASCEGQSDYWAQTCMTALGYSKTYSQTSGFVLAQVLASLNGENRPSFSTPDQTVVRRTKCGHPNAQCRLDTYVNALDFKERPLCWYKP